MTVIYNLFIPCKALLMNQITQGFPSAKFYIAKSNHLAAFEIFF